MMTMARKMAHLGLRLWMMAWHRFEPRGRVKLDRPSLIVANHASHLDIAAIFCALPFDELMKVRTAAAKDVIFALPPAPLTILKFLFGVFPFERKNGSGESLERCERYLKAGFHVGAAVARRRVPRLHAGLREGRVPDGRAHRADAARGNGAGVEAGDDDADSPSRGELRGRPDRDGADDEDAG